MFMCIYVQNRRLQSKCNKNMDTFSYVCVYTHISKNFQSNYYGFFDGEHRFGSADMSYNFGCSIMNKCIYTLIIISSSIIFILKMKNKVVSNIFFQRFSHIFRMHENTEKSGELQFSRYPLYVM